VGKMDRGSAAVNALTIGKTQEGGKRNQQEKLRALQIGPAYEKDHNKKKHPIIFRGGGKKLKQEGYSSLRKRKIVHRESGGKGG